MALLTPRKMAAPKVGRVDQVIVSFSGGNPQSFSTTAEVETETGQVTERDISNVMASLPAASNRRCAADPSRPAG